VGCDLCIVDEAAHANPDLFYDVLFPILQMKKTSMMALSSPEGTTNHFSKWIKLPDPDNPTQTWFRTLECFMICEDCRKLPKEEQIRCTHVKQTAFWINQQKSRKFMSLYELNPSRALLEYGGMVDDDFIPCFKQADLVQFFDKPVYRTESTPDYIFVTCDPSGGGMSQLAICSGYFDEALNWVVSVPSYRQYGTIS
jgi:hypothetical protein